MQRRAFHLASLLLLLASLSPAEAASMYETRSAFATPYVRVLMAQHHAATATALHTRGGEIVARKSIALLPAERDRVLAVWATNAPSKQAMALQAVTGSGL
jgi:hypothetical protein